MDMRRFLPILLIAFAALFILPQLFKGGGSKTLSTKDRGRLTLDAIGRIDRAQQKEFSSSGKYTDDLAQLAARDKVLASELTIPLVVDLDISGNGKSYLARVSSDVVSTAVSPRSSSITNGTKTGRKISNGLPTSGPPWAARSSSNRIVATRVERVAARQATECEPAAVADTVPLDGLVGVARAGRPESAGRRQQA